MNDELRHFHGQLVLADTPEALFGALGTKLSATGQLKVAKILYHRFAKIAHEDRYTDPDDKKLAHDAFQRLNAWWQQAQQRINDGTYGKKAPNARIKGKKRVYEVIKAHRIGDLSTVYKARTGVADTVAVKIGVSASMADLMAQEAVALKTLTDANLHGYFPELYERLRMPDGRPATVMSFVDGVYNLHDVEARYPEGVDPRHFVWIWKRLLFVLGYAHSKGIVHGGVLPPHVLVNAKNHGVTLVDWCYSAPIGQPLRAISRNYKSWYPLEVFQKRPATAATDLFMAARCMIDVLGGLTPAKHLPYQFNGLLRSCLIAAPGKRPQDAWELQDELTDAAKTVFGPSRFVALDMT